MSKKSRRSNVKKGSKPNRNSANIGGGNAQRDKKYVPDISSFGTPPSPAAVADFWDWFQKSETALSHLSHMEEANRIDRRLKRVHSGLTYEIGRFGGTRHLIISAAGIKECFNTVLSLIRAAPTTIDGWRFTAFRDRRDVGDTTLSLQGRPYPSRHLRYALEKDDRRDKIGITMFYGEGFEKFRELDEDEQNYYGHIGFLYLDTVLGEYDVEMHIGAVKFLSRREGEAKFGNRYDTYPLTQLAYDFDGWLSEKIGRTRPEKGGWSALANLGHPLDVVGSNNRNATPKKSSPTSVACRHDEILGGFDDRGIEKDSSTKNGTSVPLPTSIQGGIIGTPPQEDPRADIFREVCDGLITDEGMANMESLITLLDTPGIGNPDGIKDAKEHGFGWDRSVPIGSVVKIVDLKSRTDLNGKLAKVISHIYDDMRIGVRVQSSGKQVSLKPVNAELVRENKN
mmetsp:Transcript_27851/g.55795  ORF Transcript_27851/g.55795 Transcript_27851/m.55795 type:complete len:454 (+) Transcript_27851:73-1434(+)